MRALERARDEYWDYCRQQYDKAEHAVGHLVRMDRYPQLRTRHGSAFMALYYGNIPTAYCYASEELQAWWEHNTRLTFAEYALQSGVGRGNRRIRERAARAPGARTAAKLRVRRR